MIKVKNIFTSIVVILLIALLVLFYPRILEQFKEVFDPSPKVIVPDVNEYKKDYSFKFISNTDNFIPQNKDDLLNIFYTTLNSGWDSFTFYCSNEYSNCINDVKELSKDDVLLSNINNFVSPYNSYQSIKTTYDETGEITIDVIHLYNKYEIQKIKPIINDIIANNISDNMSDEDKILAIHDYIINNTTYDIDAANDLDTPYDSSRIQGVLFDNYAMCGGYTDTMAVILDELGIKNFKISSSDHVWNAVYIDGKWLHLDLTWDDPYDEVYHTQTLSHTYFLIDNDELFSINKAIADHTYREDIYLEFNN